MNEATEPTTCTDTSSIDALFEDRFHGAVNIRGIRYQLRYSVLCAVDMVDKDSCVNHIVLEGIEDVDVNLNGFHSDKEYVQVKTSQKPWKWHQLKDPIASFIEALRADPSAQFLLVFDFPLTGDIADLARLTALTAKRRDEITRKFLDLCMQKEATADEARELLARVRMHSISEELLLAELRHKVADVFDLAGSVVDLYIDALTARFIEWAKDRRTVLADDIARVHTDFQELLAEESEFQAHGRGLLDSLSWAGSADISSFFDGKATQAAHIAAGLDVVRPRWLQLMDDALNKTRVCVVRSSSGQGKSALAYRYVHEYWPVDSTFVLQLAETHEHVRLISRYLRSRAKFLPIVRLLIDGASSRTRLWPYVAQEVSNLGGQVLVTVRNEDWFRFSQHSLLSYEVIEPSLDLAEAQSIYREFKRRGRIHESVRTAEHSYELVGQPHLLMEYVYFITHGQMLEDRLRDQMREIQVLGEDPVKLEVLRRVSLASLYGASLDAGAMFDRLRTSADPQQILSSLSGEYLTVTGGSVRALHQLRSDHLVRILHEDGFPDRTNTAVNCFRSACDSDLPDLIAFAVTDPEVDRLRFLDVVAEFAARSSLSLITTCLAGLFAGGERAFLNANAQLFDESYTTISSGAPFLLGVNLGPIIKYDIVGKMHEIFGDRPTGFDGLADLLPQVKQSGRGLDLCRTFLATVCRELGDCQLLDDLQHLGWFLDWCALAEMTIGCWDEVKDTICCDSRVFDLPLEDFCLFAQGLHRYDPHSYRRWLDRHLDTIVGFMKLNTDCTKITLDTDSVSIRFIVDPEAGSKDHGQAVERLAHFRSVFPEMCTYCSEGVWLLPFGVRNEYDDTGKHIPKENLPLISDAAKNRVWIDLVEARYRADSYYEFQQAWYNARLEATTLVKAFSKDLRKFLQNEPCDFAKVDELRPHLIRLLEWLPPPPVQYPQNLKEELNSSINKWSTSLQNFLRQMADEDEDGRRLSVFNFSDACRYLDDMRIGLSVLLDHSPDYFGMKDVESDEDHSYGRLGELMEVWLDPPRMHQRDIVKYARQRQADRNQQVASRVSAAIEAVAARDMSLILPDGGYVEHPLRYYPMAFSVEDPCRPELTLLRILPALVSVRDVTDYFCLIPTHEGHRIGEWGYTVPSSQLEKIANGEDPSWVTFAAQTPPVKALALLHHLPLRIPTQLDLRTRFLAILASIDWMQRLRSEIDTIPESGSEYDLALQDRWCIYLQARGREIVQLLDELQESISSDSEIQRPQKESFAASLNNMRLGLLADDLEHIQLPDLGEAEFLIDSLWSRH